jgi:hypothetical protein
VPFPILLSGWLQHDGVADLSVTDTDDLAEDSERQALQELRVDATAREALAQRFAERLGTVADATADRTGRRMAIEDPLAEVATGDDTEPSR